MSLALAYVLFFFGTAFISVYTATKTDNVYAKAGLIFFALVMVYFSSGMLMALASYVGIPILVDIFAEAGLFIAILIIMLLAVLFIQLLTWTAEKVAKVRVGH